jgi:hypothetical protein
MTKIIVPGESGKICVFDEDDAERLVRLVYQLAEAVDVMVFNRQNSTRCRDPHEKRLLAQLNGDLTWAKLDEIF